MKRAFSIVMLFLLLFAQTLPVLASATSPMETAEKVKMPQKPMERVIAESGDWYKEQIGFEKESELVTAFKGSYQMDEVWAGKAPAPIQFKLNENFVVKSIVLPFATKAAAPLSVTLKDQKGNLYGPFAGTETFANTATDQVKATDQAKAPALGEALVSEATAVNYVVTPTSDLILEKGSYEMTLSSPQGLIKNEQTGDRGAFLIRGVNQDGYERYKQALKETGMTPEAVKAAEENAKNGVTEEEILGSESFIPDSLKDYKYLPGEKPPKKQRASFELKEEAMISSIVFNTYNEGKGAPPGTLSILDKSGTIIGEFSASGKMLGDVANGAWTVVPNLVMPIGKYEIGMSNPEVAKYDKFGKPEFYITVEDPPTVRKDFTGTYIVNFDAVKTSTLMGPVTGQKSSFSLKDFELIILDKGSELELIGVYQGMTFSQAVVLTEEGIDKLAGTASFVVDLSNLPAKTKITADVVITLTQKGNKPPHFAIEGIGTYAREGTAEKGADYNTYALKGAGTLKTRELPAFVMTAMASATHGAGNIPGPGSAAEGAVGLLFAPLIGLIIHVLQELLNKPEVKKYSKEWYKQEHPEMSDEQIMWEMIAAADPGDGGSGGFGSEDSSGSADEGGESDDGGGESYGGGDSGGSEDTGGSEDSGSESDSGEGSESDGEDNEGYPEGDSQDETEDGDSEEDSEEETEEETEEDSEEETKPDEVSEETKSDSETQTGTEGKSDGDKPSDENTQEEEQQQPPEVTEPEKMTLQVDHTGRTAEYEKNPETGEWVNSETGGVLDLERYERDVKPNFEKDKAFVDAQRDKLERGDTEFDRELRRQQAERDNAEKRAAYIEKLGNKYGTTNEDELKQIISANNVKEQQNSASWQRIGNALETAETSAKVVGVIADTAVDGLANITGPAGAQVRAVYKVTKSIAGNMAENGMNTSAFVSGAIKGGADAATDFIDSTGKKIATTIAGEAIGGLVQDGVEGLKGGIVDGISKVGQGAIIDKLGGKGFGNQVSTMGLGNGNVRVAVLSGGKWVGRNLTEGAATRFVSGKLTRQAVQSAVKSAGALLDEFAVKPNITEPIKNSLKS